MLTPAISPITGRLAVGGSTLFLPIQVQGTCPLTKKLTSKACIAYAGILSLTSLHRNHTVVLQWKPSQSNILANQTADALAKESATKEQEDRSTTSRKQRPSSRPGNTTSSCNNIHTLTDLTPTICCQDQRKWPASGCVQAATT